MTMGRIVVIIIVIMFVAWLIGGLLRGRKR